MIRGRLETFFEPPHPALLEAGAGGERLVANTRLVFWIFIGLAPLSTILAGGRETPIQVWISFGGVLVAIAISGVLIFVVRRVRRVEKLGIVTSSIDVTLISATLLVASLIGGADFAIDSEVAWAVYLLAVGATALRFDVSTCLAIGLLTLIEYVAVVAIVVHVFDVAITGYDLLILVSRLALIVAATAIAMGIVHRSRELVRASGTDHLTGLASRAYFEERFEAELARSKRSATPMALVIFDLDRFKAFNDDFGHEAGDDALRRIAHVMTEKKRRQDFVARWGGEELTMILPDTDRQGGHLTAERICEALRNEKLTDAPEAVTLTASAGVAEYPSDADRTRELFKIADQRLFLAKRLGRDRVVSDSSSFDPAA